MRQAPTSAAHDTATADIHTNATLSLASGDQV